MSVCARARAFRRHMTVYVALYMRVYTVCALQHIRVRVHVRKHITVYVALYMRVHTVCALQNMHVRAHVRKHITVYVLNRKATLTSLSLSFANLFQGERHRQLQKKKYFSTGRAPSLPNEKRCYAIIKRKSVSVLQGKRSIQCHISVAFGTNVAATLSQLYRKSIWKYTCAK